MKFKQLQQAFPSISAALKITFADNCGSRRFSDIVDFDVAIDVKKLKRVDEALKRFDEEELEIIAAGDQDEAADLLGDDEKEVESVLSDFFDGDNYMFRFK